jgi:hypothetical protein
MMSKTQWTAQYLQNYHPPIQQNTWKTSMEVAAAIKNLKKGKSPGEDNITAEMMQAGEDCSVKMMHTLCNKIYHEKQSPEDWGKAIIVPIHKKGDKKDCNNYRGISLLSVARFTHGHYNKG